MLPDGVRGRHRRQGRRRARRASCSRRSEFLTTFLLIFAGIALVVGAFLIVNTFSILVAQRSRELALLRALGASRRQVTRSVLLEAFVVGVVGSTLGLGLGLLLAMAIRALFAQVRPRPVRHSRSIFAPRTVLAAYVVGHRRHDGRGLAAGPPTAGSRRSQALRDDVALPESSIRRRLLVGARADRGRRGGRWWSACSLDVPHCGCWVGGGILVVLLGVDGGQPGDQPAVPARSPARSTGVFGTVGNLAGQNSLRNPRRTAATASALMIGLALACTMAILGASAKASVDEAVEENFVGDYVVSSAFGEPFSPSDRRPRWPTVDGRRAGASAALRPRPSATATDVRSAASTPPTSATSLDLSDRSGGELADLDRRHGPRRRGLGRGPRLDRRRHRDLARCRPASADAAGRRHLRGQPG